MVTDPEILIVLLGLAEEEEFEPRPPLMGWSTRIALQVHIKCSFSIPIASEGCRSESYRLRTTMSSQEHPPC